MPKSPRVTKAPRKGEAEVGDAGRVQLSARDVDNPRPFQNLDDTRLVLVSVVAVTELPVGIAPPPVTRSES